MATQAVEPQPSLSKSLNSLSSCIKSYRSSRRRKRSCLPFRKYLREARLNQWASFTALFWLRSAFFRRSGRRLDDHRVHQTRRTNRKSCRLRTCRQCSELNSKTRAMLEKLRTTTFSSSGLTVFHLWPESEVLVLLVCVLFDTRCICFMLACLHGKWACRSVEYRRGLTMMRKSTSGRNIGACWTSSCCSWVCCATFRSTSKWGLRATKWRLSATKWRLLRSAVTETGLRSFFRLIGTSGARISPINAHCGVRGPKVAKGGTTAASLCWVWVAFSAVAECSLVRTLHFEFNNKRVFIIYFLSIQMVSDKIQSRVKVELFVNRLSSKSQKIPSESKISLFLASSRSRFLFNFRSFLHYLFNIDDFLVADKEGHHDV